MGERFDTTAWSVVAAAQGTDSQAATAALEVLCLRYWSPLYTYVRLKGHSREDAEDLTQEFFTRLLSRDSLQSVDRSKGRFRTFILACMDNFLRDEWQKDARQKRGGPSKVIPIDFAAAEDRLEVQSRLGVDAREAFDRQWAESVLDSVHVRLKAEYEAAGKGAVFASLSRHLIIAPDSGAYVEAANELGMTEGAVKVAVHRLRKRFAEAVRQEIAGTVASDLEIDKELVYLVHMLSG